MLRQSLQRSILSFQLGRYSTKRLGKNLHSLLASASHPFNFSACSLADLAIALLERVALGFFEAFFSLGFFALFSGTAFTYENQ